MDLPILILLTLLGLSVGSFCNVLIYRLPKEEDFVRTPSHCMTCGHALKWYELIPLVSWLIQGGKCRACGVKLSAQYPIVEAVNGLMWLATGLLFRFVYQYDWLTVGLHCGLFSLLLVLSVIDWRTFTIPNGVNLAIFLLGVVRLVTDLKNWPLYVIGMVAVSAVFLLLHIATHGNGLGMGDVKLVGAAGLLIGWQNMLLAVLVGSVAGALIHSVRMKRGADRRLAFGPYLAAGIWFAALVGQPLINAYLGLFVGL
ncbi:MAG: prepilin peptidase [Oscillospiraceae bacterium]|nr:prepilin peptidase [Oscillospiraceae bacterium]